MSAYFAADGTVTQLDGKAEPTDTVTNDDLKDASKITRLITSMLKDLAALKRRFAPDHNDFDIVSTGTSITPFLKSLNHGYKGRVRTWIVSQETPGSISSSGPALNNGTVTVAIWFSGKLTIRVEEGG